MKKLAQILKKYKISEKLVEAGFKPPFKFNKMKVEAARMDANARKDINSKLSLISTHDSSTYYDQIPIQQVFELLRVNGISPVQEDNTAWEGLLLGREGSTTLALAYMSGEEMIPIDNCMLNVSWYKMQSGRYEVIFYLT